MYVIGSVKTLAKILQYRAQSGTRILCSFRLNNKLEHSEKSVPYNNSQQTPSKLTLELNNVDSNFDDDFNLTRF